MPPAIRKALFLVLTVAVLLPGCARAPRRVPSRPMPPMPAATSMNGFYYTVQKGETLYRIAKHYNMDWHLLMSVNHISDTSCLEPGQKIFIPQTPSQTYISTSAGPLSPADIRRSVGPKHYSSDWRTITVHHSGTAKGGAQAFDRNHRQRHMGGLFYHFVIGNGSNTADGALEVGWRWRRQVKANRPYDIQICLVGDFDQQYVSDAQFNTLLGLVQELRQQYGISVHNIRRHEDIPGKHTACPGDHFPFQRLIDNL